jgi:hypothetical protein
MAPVVQKRLRVKKTKHCGRTTALWTSVMVGLFLVALPLSGRTQDGDLNRPLVASGASPMAQHDVASARDLAVQEALRAAVEQALARLLPAQRIVRFYPLLLERILVHPMSYVQDYQIIYEGQGQQFYRVAVQTSLYTDSLKQDLRQLGLFLSESARPRVVLLIAERTAPQAPWNWWWQTAPPAEQHLDFSKALSRLFSARGLVVLDPPLLLGQIPQDPAIREPLLDNSQGASMGRALGAQLVVLGQVSHQPPGAGTAASVTATLRALKAENGEVLATVSDTLQVQPADKGDSSGQGFAALAERLASQLADPMLIPFSMATQAPRPVTVQIQGVRTYGDLILIKEFLQDAPGVTQVSQIKLEAGQGSVSLVLGGALDDLVRALQKHDFATFAINTALSSDNLITISILGKS